MIDDLKQLIPQSAAADGAPGCGAPGEPTVTDFRLPYPYHDDHLGTPQRMTDTGGNIAWEAYYYPFGEIYDETVVQDNLLRFPGQYHDDETDLYYNWHRYYNPMLGRYYQADPLIFNRTFGLYGYAQSNPVNRIDPWGLYSWSDFMQDWEEVTDVREAIRFWENYSENAMNRGGWVRATMGDVFGGLLKYLGPLTVQENAEIIAKPCVPLKTKIVAGVKIAGVGIAWYYGPIGLRYLSARSPWLGTLAFHPAHEGLGRHLELIIRLSGGRNLKVIIPGKYKIIYIGIKSKIGR